jgi:hypothetical protein
MAHPFRTEHATMRAITAGLRRMAFQPLPPRSDELTAARWQLFYSILHAFALKDRLAYSRLVRHPDPLVASNARQFVAENEALYAMFVDRSEDWTPEVAERHWDEFSTSLRQLTDVIDTRLAREERELLPHLETAPPATGETILTRDWAAEEERLRARLGIA